MLCCCQPLLLLVLLLVPSVHSYATQKAAATALL